ncbi:MAG: hypothetical protein PHU85_04775 [Phycisphaerae bacterium]|nr:hypothetical protein [Phycisphaerae bacterium]
MANLREYLESCALSAKGTESFRHPEAIAGTRFDPELAYLPADVVGQDGVAGCNVFYSFEPNGARRLVNYRHRPCRVNTYGNSFTECNQVSDGETWQEALAAHFGEPIRNFGVGGYGVYQAYLRMKRMETTDAGTPYVILNVWNDDHYRSLMACRWLHLPWFQAEHRDNPGFHAMPWAHIRLDLQTGSWAERPNPFATPESLRRLSEPSFVYETFRNDPIVKLQVLAGGGHVDDISDLNELAEFFGVGLDRLYDAYAWASTGHIVRMAKQFAESRGKRLMILLSYSASEVARALSGAPRRDQSLVDDLAKVGLPIVDILARYRTDYAAFRLTPEDYCKRQYIGHYNPTGNHFFAFAIREDLVAWLDPKPPAYDPRGAKHVDMDVLQVAAGPESPKPQTRGIQ